MWEVYTDLTNKGTNLKHTFHKKSNIGGKGILCQCLIHAQDVDSTGEGFAIKPASHLQVQHLPDILVLRLCPLKQGALGIFHLVESYVDVSDLADVFTVCESLY